LTLQLQEKLGLSYKNTNELNKIVDNLPSSRPKFRRNEIVVGDETLEVYHRDILECVRALYGDPEFSPHLVFKPERHYADEDKTVRMYGDMHTGKWWWDTQV
jgi:Plavaka transposase